MNNIVESFEQKIELLKSKLSENKCFDNAEKALTSDFNNLDRSPVFAVFISVCNSMERAKVFRGTAPSVEQAWDIAYKSARDYVNRKKLAPKWVKLDIMNHCEKKKTSDTFKLITENYNQFFRRGLAFDDDFKLSLIEAEMNGNNLIAYKNKQRPISLTVINNYASDNCGKTITSMPDELYLFDCIGWFVDDNMCVFELYSEGLNCGRRIIEKCDKDITYNIIRTGADYLANQINEHGRFTCYGVYPINHKVQENYNILRHTSSIWSIICSYSLTRDSETLRKADLAIEFLLKHIEYKNKSDNTAFVIERSMNEVKLGGNGLAIILLTQYMIVLKSEKYKDICIALGNGILELQDKNTGEFTHVLNYPSYTVKEKNRIVYYDGEAAFALTRLYSLTKTKKYLDAAKLTVDRFLRNNYIKYRDHWVAYSMNEITKYVPEERYFEFGLRNAQENLNIIYNQPTSYHTYLELLMVTFELYDRIIKNNYKISYLSEFRADDFIKTIFHRAEHMLNGYWYPEYAMYMKHPDKLVGGFYVRHDAYRTRIDDVQHFCGAYYVFYLQYDRMKQLLEKNEEKSHYYSENIADMVTIKELLSHLGLKKTVCSDYLNKFGNILNMSCGKFTDNILSTDDGVFFDRKHELADHFRRYPQFKPRFRLIVSNKEIEGLPCVCTDNVVHAQMIFIEYVIKKQKVSTIAVTGSVGKTTVKDIIFNTLCECAPTACNSGSSNGPFGASRAVLAMGSDTKYLVNEMGLRLANGYFSRVSKAIRPKVCVITNIGTAHIENFRSQEHILEHKLKCADYMDKKTGLLLINGDDPLLTCHQYEFITKTFAIDNTKADYYPENIVLTNDSTSFTAVCPGGKRLEVKLSVPGRHNIYGALAAIAIGQHFRLPEDSILRGLQKFSTSGIRQNVFKAYKNNTVIFDCFGASPEANITAFNMLRDMRTDQKQRKIAVLGHMMRLGRYSERMHKETGEKLAEYNFDLVVTYSGNSKYFTDEVCKKGGKAYHFYEENDFITFVKESLTPGDYVLFKGIRKFCDFDIAVNKILDPNYKPVPSVYCGLHKDDLVLHTNAPSIAVIGASDNRLLFGKGIHFSRCPASLISILTVITALKKANDINETVVISKSAVSSSANCSKAPLKPGEQYSIKDLCWLVMKKSACDAAYAIAEHIGGTTSAFADMMNSMANYIGACNTICIEPFGKAVKNYSTAYDLALIISYSFKNIEFCKLVSQTNAEIKEISTGTTRKFGYSSKLTTFDENDELQLYSPEIMVIKEGKNNLSGKCIAAAVKGNGELIVQVMLGCEENEYNCASYDDTKRILDYFLSDDDRKG